MGSEALMRRRLDALQHFATLIAAQAHAHNDGLPDATAAINSHVIAGGIIQAIVAWLEGRLDVTRDQLIDQCAALFTTAAGATAARR
jgi:hypothetical protein